MGQQQQQKTWNGVSLEFPWLKASNWERRASEKAVQYSSPNLASK